jgi:Predicted AAA-ATPase/PD-(D/E)XK nuclease superfamily
MRLPIGYDHFPDVIRHELDIVDKSLFIQEVLDHPEIQSSVITRPRRFGKTLNLSMLHAFLTPEIRGDSTRDVFKGLKIAEMGEKYLRHQGKYPVIFISFKDIKYKDFTGAYDSLRTLISNTYQDHSHLLESAHLNEGQKESFLKIFKGEATVGEVRNSLYSLSFYLHQHFGVKPWLLIDEYDTPIQAGYLCGYYDDIIQFMRALFGSALKTNTSLERAVITGILRVSKESLFSGVNNLKVYSLFNADYSQHFGFTEAEVTYILEASGLGEHSAGIKQWYNGYQIGGTVLYNPWSLVNCIYEKGSLRPYWVNTSGNDLIRHLLARGDEQIKMDLESIIHGESITALIDENMVFGDLEKDRSALWSLLLFSGYFKVIHSERKDERIQCELGVPNQEIMALYRGVIRDWFAKPIGYEQYLAFLLSLTEGRIEEFTHRLQKYLIETLSIFDASGQNPEKFYHGFILGMMVSLRETHEVKSNRESGYGRYDVMLIPKDPEQLGIILEFKTVFEENADLGIAAKQAMQQINQRNYAAELEHRGIQRILKMALVFRGKKVHVLTDQITDPIA